MNRVSGDTPLYTISIAARLVRVGNGEDPMHPQTLRMYERLGLVNPQRVGRNRLYSDNDIERLRAIQNLTQEHGINLAGVMRVLELEQRIRELEQRLVSALARLDTSEGDTSA